MPGLYEQTGVVVNRQQSEERMRDAALTREELVAKAGRKHKKVWEMAIQCRRIDLLEGREELFKALNHVYHGARVFDRVLREISTLEEALWYIAQFESNSQRLLRMTRRAAAFCATLEEAQTLFDAVPPTSKARRPVLARACELASTKEELAGFIIRNNIG